MFLLLQLCGYYIYIYMYLVCCLKCVSCIFIAGCIVFFFYESSVYVLYSTCCSWSKIFCLSQIQNSKIPTKEHRPRKSTYFLNTAELQLNKSKLLKKTDRKSRPLPKRYVNFQNKITSLTSLIFYLGNKINLISET